MNFFGPEISLSIIWTPNGNSIEEPLLRSKAGNEDDIGSSLSEKDNLRWGRVRVKNGDGDRKCDLIVEEMTAAGLTVARKGVAERESGRSCTEVEHATNEQP
jgi:hypothetical protein